ncbi:MAG TPA: AtpZ/AtpI family protein [Candidatus Andersenbacteria bacterium]|nr:AtpZ/AtpI family protein [Candidatus Andersenbacteria bacterium]
MEQQQSQKKSTNTQYTTPLSLLSLVGELGFIIALPLLIMVFVGIQLDRWFNVPHVFLIIGMLFAALCSSIIVLRKVMKASKDAGL